MRHSVWKSSMGSSIRRRANVQIPSGAMPEIAAMPMLSPWSRNTVTTLFA